MTFFAIRRKSDGLFLPGGRARGFTHDMPTAAMPPRLFATRIGAQRALACWLKGEWVEHSEARYSYGPDDGYHDVWAEPPKTPPADRIAADMEVVTLRLTEEAA